MTTPPSNPSPYFRRIVVGIEDHEQSRDALSLAAGLARTLGSELLVAAAIEYDPVPLGRQYYDAARAEHFARIFASADEFLTDLPHRRFELDREAPEAIERLAAEESADLIVIGSTHRGLFSRTVEGTVADKLVGGRICPVLVASHGYAGRTHAGLGTIGVGFDGGAESGRAMEVAEDLAAALGCELKVIAAVPAFEDVPDPLRATRESTYRERVASARRKITRVPAGEVVEFGDAAHVLASQGLSVDFLVVGSHGRGRFMRTLMGSVVSELTRIAPCPVLVVPDVHEPLDEAGETDRDRAGV